MENKLESILSVIRGYDESPLYSRLQPLELEAKNAVADGDQERLASVAKEVWRLTETAREGIASGFGPTYSH